MKERETYTTKALHDYCQNVAQDAISLQTPGKKIIYHYDASV